MSAPVALFAYQRPEHASRALTALAQCRGAGTTDVHVFIDGPASLAAAEKVEATWRSVREHEWGFRSFNVERASANLGLAASVERGVSALCRLRGRVVVIEDDLVVLPDFLVFMNAMLDRYRDDPRVATVCAHNFGTGDTALRGAFLLPCLSTWGWGTWERAWKGYDSSPNVASLLRRSTRRGFDLGGTYPYTAMLLSQKLGIIDSWGIRWYWSTFRSGQLSVFPFPGLVRNEGFGPGATHTTNLSSAASQDWFDASTGDWEAPAEVSADAFDYWKSMVGVSALRRLASYGRLLSGLIGRTSV